MRLTEVRKKEIEELGYKAFMAMFELSACPFKDETEVALWRQGFANAKMMWDRPYSKPKTFLKPKPRSQSRNSGPFSRSGGRR